MTAHTERRHGAPARKDDRRGPRSPTERCRLLLEIARPLMGVVNARSHEPRSYSTTEVRLLQAIADVAASALRNVRHVEELERRRREAEGLEELVRALITAPDVGVVVDRVAEAAGDLLNAAGATVWFLEEGGMEAAASRGPKVPPAGTRFRLEDDVARLLTEERRPLTPEALERSPLGRRIFLEKAGARCALLVPLTMGDGVIGGLSVGAVGERRFGEEDIRLLERLAAHAAVAVQNVRLRTRLQTLSLTDPLTGLPNRRHMEIHLAREFAAASRGRELSVVLFDVDNLKCYNDTFGHLAGDEAIRRTGALLAAETRAMNLVARFGGDEFLAVISGTSLDGARRHARRVEEKVRRHPDLGGHGVTLTAGVATWSREMESYRELIRAADEEMYRAKGRRSGP